MYGIFCNTTFLHNERLYLRKNLKLLCDQNKDCYQGRDYCLSVILFSQHLVGTLLKDIEELLFTLMEIGRLAYLKAQERCPKTILRLYNVCYINFLRCICVFGKKPKIAKTYGVYFHSLVVH